jgi:hypothetical protein
MEERLRQQEERGGMINWTIFVCLLMTPSTELLQRLHPVTEAFHDTRDASPSCQEGTRVQLLQDISAWFDDIDSSSSRVFWLNGLAGTGKTAVARSVAVHAHEWNRLAGTFFFSRNNASTRNAAAVIPTILYQLATHHPVFRTPICTAIKADPAVRDRGIATQIQRLLNNLHNADMIPRPLLIVIDALDECDPGDNDVGVFVIRSLIDTLARLPSFKLFVSSRVERNIKNMFTSDSLAARKLALHYDIEEHVVSSDISIYLERKFSEIAQNQHLELPFPSVENLIKLVERAGTLFIYAATVLKYVADPEESPLARMEDVVNQTPGEIPYQYGMLDGLYAQVIVKAAKTSGNPGTHEDALHMILSTVIMVQEPLPVSALADLADIRKEKTTVILQRLSSILLVENDAPVRLYHPSFPDFIQDKERCRHKEYSSVERFLVVPSESHIRLALRCLQIMNGHLRQDICNIKDAWLMNREISDLDTKVAQAAPRQLRYACKFWIVHLRLGGQISDEICGELAVFTNTHLFHWVELLSLMSELDIVQREIPPLITYLNVCQIFA